MKLVWRKVPRGKFVRDLTQAETGAICDAYGAGRTATEEQQDLVRIITGEMVEDSLWLQCSCNPELAPLNTVVEKASGRHLRHLLLKLNRPQMLVVHKSRWHLPLWYAQHHALC